MKPTDDPFQNLVDALKSPPVNHIQIANKLELLKSPAVKIKDNKKMMLSKSMGEFDQYNSYMTRIIIIRVVRTRIVELPCMQV